MKDYLISCSPSYVRMWIISTILEDGDIDEAITKALVMKAKRPSYLPPQGFLLSVLGRIGSATQDIPGAVDVPVIESSYSG